MDKDELVIYAISLHGQLKEARMEASMEKIKILKALLTGKPIDYDIPEFSRN